MTIYNSLYCFKHLRLRWVLKDRRSVVCLCEYQEGVDSVSCMDQWVVAKVPLSTSHSEIAQLFTFQMCFAAQVSQQARKAMELEKLIFFYYFPFF